jgi:hypothetical protein
MAKKEYEKITTPLVECLWAQVTKPASKYGTQGVRPEDQEYKITALLDPNKPKHEEFLAKLKALWQQCGTEMKCPGGIAKNKPFKKHKRKEDDSPTGLFEVTFKTGVKFPVRVFDAKGNKITGDLNIGNGSQVKVAGSYTFYGPDKSGGGVKLYLNAVQVVELVEWSGGEASDYGFAAGEGFNVEAPFEAAFATPEAGGETPADDSESLPF